MSRLYVRHTCRDGSTALRRLTPAKLRIAQANAWTTSAKVEQIDKATAQVEKFDATWDY